MIIFRNEGHIDMRAVKTFGLSSKSGQDKIGRFGTGLKYATAVIMRHGGEMTIQSNGETYIIGRQSEEFRGTEITSLTINGDPLPFTTDLGRDWEPWMAFRELYANALDEGGGVSRSETPQPACGDETVISVSLASFEAIFFSMDEHFIDENDEPFFKSDKIEVYKGRSLFVFYKGVAVMKLKEPSVYRYNLLGYLDLTEDRTAKYDFIVKGTIADALAASTHNDVIQAAADCRNKFEAGLDYSSATASQEFLGATISLGSAANPTATALVRAQLPADGGTATVLSKSQPGGECLMNALSVLRLLNADLTICQFVLAEGLKFYGDMEVKKKAIFINEAIFSDQDRMTVAVIEGYAAIAGKHWMARRLIEGATP
jgi:hypothetical protein